MNNNFADKIKGIKDSLNSRMTKDTPKETLEFIAATNKELDSLQEDYEALKVEKTEIQEMYINAIHTAGSTEKPKDETPATPRSLEEIGASIKNGGK